MLGDPSKGLERLIRADAVTLHQDSLGLTDHVPGSQCRVQVLDAPRLVFVQRGGREDDAGQGCQHHSFGVVKDVECPWALEAARVSGATPWCLILVLSVMGLRVSEACGLCVGDLTVVSGTYRLRVERKGGISQVLEVPSALGEVLFDLARSRPPGPPLLSGPRGGWLSRRQAQRIVASLAEEAGIDHHVHPHLLRHTFSPLP